ncbi:discoidin domain-containing protein [Rosistilla ulvae]|nr:discoidin domain-containing protein [Rosistilla ulvae]
MPPTIRTLSTMLVLLFSWTTVFAAPPISVSGVYPHLTMWNSEGECGTGAVVPWQGRLWCVTYAPHRPNGSSDKLYEITADLQQIIFPDSVGGTPANRMIHRESNQLLIGPYVIDADRNVRVIPPPQMFGRLTGNARHLVDPAGKVYYATMEEGLYEVDVNSLEVKCLLRDGNGGAPEVGSLSKLPGYHGKGLYSSQGRLLYANNGERHRDVSRDPTIESGALAQWFGEGDWQMVRRNQFTELTGPGGIHGNPNPETDPVWTLGWDARSILLGLLENQQWHFYRLPKGSHSYDGSHGWNTEWPRIREIGQQDLLATMHGTFWRFPATFSKQNSAGIAPRSNYLKVIGDFCRWNDKVVFGCDDSAAAEFMNTRDFKAKNGAPKESNSNLWFVDSDRLDHLGPPIGRGSVWLRDDVAAGQVSDPYLFAGYDYRQLHLNHASDDAVTFTLEVDRQGNDQWTALRDVTVPAGEAVSIVFDDDARGAWIRLTSQQAASSVTANFQYRNRDSRDASNDAMFAGLAPADGQPTHYGLMRSLSHDRLGLAASSQPSVKEIQYYELNQKMQLVAVDDPGAAQKLIANVAQPAGAYTSDEASIVIVEDGKRYRLPKNDLYATGDAASTKIAANVTLADILSNSLSLNAKATASSVHADYQAQGAVDGSLADDNRWVGRSGEGSNWLELDLGEAKTFQNVWVVTGWNNSADLVVRDFDIQIKQGDQWTTLPDGKVRGNQQKQCEVSLSKPVTAQHIRLFSPSNGFMRVTEVALFADRPNIQRDHSAAFGLARVCREVATERDLLNVHGTFYELPAKNAQGLAKIRPVATHNLAIHDFCSHNGLLLFTGIDSDAQSEHIFRSDDGRAAVWAGVVDDLWKLGKPRGIGGPWKDSPVSAGQPSDPYLMTGYDNKQIELTTTADATIALEVDVDGTGCWIPYRAFELKAGQSVKHQFPTGFSAYWVRATCDVDTTASAMLIYD